VVRHRLSRMALPVAGLSVAALALGVVTLAPVASAGSLSGTLYRDPNTSAAQWVAANPNDSRTPAIRDVIASQPLARWISSYNPSTVQSQVSAYVSAANAAGAVPQIIAYMIPNRDCGGASAGGAPDWASYNTWIDSFARGLGSQLAIVMLEPDSLALQTCGDVANRNTAISRAIGVIKAANPQVKVYLDAGHSAWNSAATQAQRLSDAGVLQADGFYSNMSNFRLTADEIAYGKSILSSLGNPANLHQIIDTARNGNGPLGSEWCDPAGRRVGNAPTLNTGEDTVDAYLWAKPPGEADGCRASAGTFVPDLAYELAGGASYTTTTTTSTSTTTPTSTSTSTTRSTSTSTPTSTTTRSSTTTPTSTTTTPTSTTTRSTTTTTPTSTTTGGRVCTASYRVISQWQGGFQGEITVTAGASAISGWTVTWAFPNGQAITQLWNAGYTGTSTVTAKNLSWNGSLAPSASTNFGFTGTWNSSNGVPTVACVAS
jgi:endoglucanase